MLQKSTWVLEIFFEPKTILYSQEQIYPEQREVKELVWCFPYIKRLAWRNFIFAVKNCSHHKKINNKAKTLDGINLIIWGFLLVNEKKKIKLTFFN